jgi:hypothetical protein
MEAQRLEKPESRLRCDKCGHALNSEDGVVVKDTNGEAKSRYHKACFQALFK